MTGIIATEMYEENPQDPMKKIDHSMTPLRRMNSTISPDQKMAMLHETKEAKKRSYGNGFRGTFYRFLDNLGLFDTSKYLKKGKKDADQMILILEDKRNRTINKIDELSNLYDKEKRSLEVLRQEYNVYKELYHTAELEIPKVSGNTTEKNRLITDGIKISAYILDLEGLLRRSVDRLIQYDEGIKIYRAKGRAINEGISDVRKLRNDITCILSEDILLDCPKNRVTNTGGGN